jgi:tetratricopeptide (TPR) repeat protein
VAFPIAPSDQVSEALSTADAATWCREHRTELGAGFVQAVKERLDRLLRSDPRQAVAAGDLAIAAAEVLGDPTLLALAKRGKAQALHQIGSCHEAIRLYEDASQLYLTAGDEVESARTRIGAIDALAYVGRTDAAIAMAKTCMEVFERHQQWVHRAKVELNLGNIYHRLDRNEDAGAQYARARAAFVRAGERDLIAVADSNLGNVATNLCNFRAAHTYYRRAGRIFQERGAHVANAMNEANIGWLYYVEGDYARAVAVLQHVKQQFEESRLPRHVAAVQADLADIYLLLHNWDAAERAAASGHAVFRELGDLDEDGRCLVTLGIISFHRGEPARCEQYLSEARDILARSNNKAREILARLALVEVKLRSGNAGEAIELAKTAVDELTGLAMPARLGHAEVLLACLYEATGDVDSARRHFQEAHQIGGRLNARSILIGASAGLGRLARRTGNAGDAMKRFEQAVEHLIRLNGVPQLHGLRIAALEGYSDVFAQLVEATLASGGDDCARRALETAELGKRQALLEFMATRVEPSFRLATGPDRAILDRVLDLRGELASLHSAIERHEERGGRRSRDLAAELASRLSEREAELDQKLSQLPGAFGCLAGSTVRPSAPSAQALERVIPSDTALIEYAEAGDRLVAFVVTEGEVVCCKLRLHVADARVASEEIGVEMTRYGWSQAGDSPSTTRADSRMSLRLSGLHRELIEPLGRLPARLVFVPNGALQQMPMHALLGTDGYLIDRHEVVYAPNADVQRFGAVRGSTDALERALVLGVGFAGSPTAVMAERVTSQFELARRFIGGEATVENLTRWCGDADVIHVVSPPSMNAEQPIVPGVRLADGWLSAADILRLDLKASLVTLHIGPLEERDEAAGLVAAFLCAGAQAVLRSLWAVADPSQYEFMGALYHHLRAGSGRAAAVRAAQRDVRSKHSHPYHWAAFALNGAW